MMHLQTGKLIIGNPKWKLENTLFRLLGMVTHQYTLKLTADYGDAPLVYATKLTLVKGNIDYFAQYQYGIHDFPYHQLRVGISFPISKLTPKNP